MGSHTDVYTYICVRLLLRMLMVLEFPPQLLKDLQRRLFHLSYLKLLERLVAVVVINALYIALTAICNPKSSWTDLYIHPKC